MSAAVLTNSQILYGQFDVTGFTGQIAWQGKVNMVDITTFGTGGFHAEAPGIQTFTHNISGISDLAGINQQIVPSSAGTEYAFSAVPTPTANVGAAGDVAFFSKGFLNDFTPWGGNIGEAAKFSMSTVSNVAVAGGYLLAPLASRGAVAGTNAVGTTAGSSIAMTGPVTGQNVYAALHVTGAVGTNLAVIVQSAPTANFASPTTRFTFSTVSAVGWQFSGPLAGPISDGFWRCTATVGTSTFTWACLIGMD
jgi:hypothetical protein